MTCRAEVRGSLISEEANWREMSFFPFTSDGADRHGAWQPMRVATGALERNTQAWIADSVIGTKYAVDLIEHLREYGDPEGCDSGDRLLQVAEGIFKSGQFGTVEREFFRAIGEFIATGKVTINCAFDARSSGDHALELVGAGGAS